jgi:DNA-binding NarL/FixJ family response regulator
MKAGATPAMRVLIADDHKIIRKTISSILQSREDIRVCGEAANGEQALSKAQILKPGHFFAGFKRMGSGNGHKETPSQAPDPAFECV